MPKIKLPTTEKEYMESLKNAYEAGQRNVDPVMNYEHWGDMEPYAGVKLGMGFAEWANKVWKYGLVDNLK